MTAVRRAGKRVYDWASLSSSKLWGLPGDKDKEAVELRQWFVNFRNDYEKTRAGLLSYPEKPDPIDWDYYRKNITKPSLVEDFTKKYESLSISYPKDTESVKIDEKEKSWAEMSVEGIARSKKNIAKYQARMDELNSMKPFEEMTLEEYIEHYPDFKPLIEKADEDAKRGRWYMEDDPELKKDIEEYFAKLEAEREAERR